MGFHNDAKSKHLGNFVLVTIGNPDEPIHRISTNKITFDDKYYKPILLNIPSISESLDIEQRKYKISSVSLSISDYLEDGVRFSDSLNQLMNQEVNIWYASQSSKTLTYFGDSLGTTIENADCYKAGTFIIRSFSQDEDKVSLNCEDLSQDKLHKDLPLEYLSDEDEVPDKYKNKPIPIVFGVVDRSPTVATQDIDLNEGEMVIKGDVIGVFPNKMFILRGDKYLVFPSSSNLLDYYGIDDDTQHTVRILESGNADIVLKNSILIDNQTDNINYKSLVDLDMALVGTLDIPIKKNLLKESFVIDNDLLNDIDYAYPANNFGEIFNLSSNGDFGFALDSFSSTAYKETHQFEELIDHVIDFEGIDNIDHVKPYYGIDYSVSITDINAVNQSYFTNIFFSIKTSEGSNEGEMDRNYQPFDGDTVSDSESVFAYENNFEDTWKPIEHKRRYMQIQPSIFAFPTLPNIIAGITSSNASLNISKIKRYAYYVIDKIHSSDFYLQCIGRGGETPTAISIFDLILAELDFDSATIPLDELGKYAFTIDKKINSKKLIEELSQSTPLFPYFKNGEFRVKSIKKTYTYPESISINTDDVISYKYDRTKIEKVYTSVNVKYHYDYGLKDFTKETGDVTPTLSGLSGEDNGYLLGVNEDYFGTDFDQPFVFESKYIRNEATASNLAKYLCGLHANQHNTIVLTLPLNYLTLELGDIVRLSNLIQGRKIFGEDYSLISDNDYGYIRNGQIIYPFWFVERIKKSLDKVEVKLYQLHEFNFTAGVVDIDDSEEPEIPEIPEIPILEYCNLINYEEYHIDEEGNPVDWNNQNVTAKYIANNEIGVICQTEIIDIPSDPVGYCLIGGVVTEQVTEANCNGTWSAMPIILGCTDENAVNTNENATVSDDALCVLQEELAPPIITNPVEDEIIPLSGTTTTEDTLILHSSSIYDMFLNQPSNSIIFKFVHPDMEISANNWVEFDWDSWNSLTAGQEIKVIFEYSGGSTANNINLLVESSGIHNVVSTSVSTTIFPYTLFLHLNRDNFGDFFNLLSYSQFQNTSIKIYTIVYSEPTTPILNITWDKSDNLIKPIPLLPNLTLIGDYIVSIVRNFTNENGQNEAVNVYYNSNPTTAIQGTDTYSHSIDLADENIPANSQLQVSVVARGFSNYNGIYLFTGLGEQLDDQWGTVPIAIASKGIVYGEIEEEDVINIVDVVALVNIILGVTTSTQEMIDDNDYNNDGLLNIVDILILVNIILDNGE